jgi:hypothetical protein
VRDTVVDIGGRVPSRLIGSPPFSRRAKDSLELALREARQLGHNHIGSEHLLLGLLREESCTGFVVLEALGADPTEIRERVIALSRVQPHRGPPSTGARLERDVDWRRHPTALLSSPIEGLSSDGIDFRVVGVLLYEEGCRVFWRLVPRPMTEPAQNRSIPPITPRRGSTEFVSLTDDFGTNYTAEGVVSELQSNGEWAGNSFFIPAPSDAVAHLRVHWQGASVVLDTALPRFS